MKLLLAFSVGGQGPSSWGWKPEGTGWRQERYWKPRKSLHAIPCHWQGTSHGPYRGTTLMNASLLLTAVLTLPMNLPEEKCHTRAPRLGWEAPPHLSNCPSGEQLCQQPMARPTSPIPALNRGWRSWKMKMVWIKWHQHWYFCRADAGQDNLSSPSLLQLLPMFC